MGYSAPMSDTAPVGEVIDRRVTPDAHEVALVKRGTEYEIIYDGNFLMSSDCRRSEKSLAELAMAPLSQRDDAKILVAGLGMGYTLRAVLDFPNVQRVDVVEISDAVVDWNRQYFGDLNGRALEDPRVHLHVADLAGFLKQMRYTPIEEVKDGWLGVLLDIDNGPSWVTRSENSNLYLDDGLAKIEQALRHGGVLAVWSAQREVEFLKRMHARFVNVAEMVVPVEIQGKAGLDYIYRGRRPPEPRAAGAGGGNGSGAKRPSA
jgi:spermidine synthase